MVAIVTLIAFPFGVVEGSGVCGGGDWAIVIAKAIGIMNFIGFIVKEVEAIRVLRLAGRCLELPSFASKTQ